MITVGLLTGIRQFIAALIEGAWRAFAGFLDLLAGVSAIQAAGLLLLVVGFFVASATGMQRHLNKKLEEDPKAQINPLFLEVRYSLVGAIYRWFVGLLNIPGRILLALLRSDDDEEDQEPPPKDPVLVPSLGPSYLWAALITIGLAILALLVEPLIRWQVGAPGHFPTWQYLLMGHRPELGPFLPLDARPYLGVVVVGGFWLIIWWTIARIVRLFHWEFMGVNLIDGADDPQTLSSWRTHFGVTDLAQRDRSYDNWARWLPLVAVPLFVISFFSMGGEPYRVGLSVFSVAFVAWISWVLHLRLSGAYRPAELSMDHRAQAEELHAAGWHDVLVELRDTQGLRTPRPVAPPRDVEPLAFSENAIDSTPLISPLLGALLPEPNRLTAMQYDVLKNLSRHSYVHLEPPSDSRTLELGARGGEDDDMLATGHQLVIAPEGSGKTTLGVLAAFNTALIHAASTLIVVRNEEQSRRLAGHLRALVGPSTLRWNLRVRRVGGDLIEDLAAGIIPDVLICDLQRLVTDLLANVDTYQPFLANLGLIVVEDLETLCGPVEVHAQLAMRRLELRLRHLRRVEELGEEQAPLFLLLAGETMGDLPAWARSLSGVDAVPRRFASQHQTRRVERARRARRNVEGGLNEEAPAQAAEQIQTCDGRTRRQLIYDLTDFVGEKRLSTLDVIDACETLAVPWHYRTCGDERRFLGRSVLPMRNEPQAYVDDPLEAAVIFFDGHATAVDREVARLGRGGARFTSKFTPLPDEELPDEEADLDSEVEEADEGEEGSEEIEPIALIMVVDDAEKRLVAEGDDDTMMASLLDNLPRPFLRPPSGYLTRRHLTGELTQHWTEVADLLDVFGNQVAPLLRELTERGAVLSERRTALERGKTQYEDRVYLRGLESALMGDGGDDERLLPGPVEDVEVASRRHVTVRERSTLVNLMRVDAESARHRFYPGHIFETSRGRHVVVDYADARASKDGAFEAGDIIAEPYLGPELTSPRREVRIELVARRDEPLAPEPIYLGQAPIGVGLFSVRARVEHRATFRLAPTSGEIRQRIYAADGDDQGAVDLRTVALGIFPHMSDDEDRQAPALTVAGARLVAAGLRAVTPLIYRGADAAMGIALNIAADEPEASQVMGDTDGFYLYDLHGGANGAAYAVERDGVDALLRLTRRLLLLEDDPRRLLALHDQWDGLLDVDERRRARQNALIWLASRLERPEEELGDYGESAAPEESS